MAAALGLGPLPDICDPHDHWTEEREGEEEEDGADLLDGPFPRDEGQDPRNRETCCQTKSELEGLERVSPHENDPRKGSYRDAEGRPRDDPYDQGVETLEPAAILGPEPRQIDVAQGVPRGSEEEESDGRAKDPARHLVHPVISPEKQRARRSGLLKQLEGVLELSAVAAGAGSTEGAGDCGEFQGS